MVERGKDCFNIRKAGAEKNTKKYKLWLNHSITEEKCNSYQLMAKHWNPQNQFGPIVTCATSVHGVSPKVALPVLGGPFAIGNCYFDVLRAFLGVSTLVGSGGALLQRHLLKLLHPASRKLTYWILLNILWKSHIWPHKNSYTNTAKHIREIFNIWPCIYHIWWVPLFK